MSTRLFVAVVTTAVLAVALSALSLATYGVLAFSLHAQLDQSLAAEGQQLRDYFLTSADSPLIGNTLPVSTEPFEAVAPTGSAFQLKASDGRVLAQSVGSRTGPLDNSAYGATDAGPQALAYETVAHANTRFRIYSLPVPLPAQSEGMLQVARPLAPVEQTLSHLRLVLVVGAGIGLLLAVGLGLLIAHITAKPIEDVASATARIRAFGEEDERLVSPGHLQEPQWLAQSLNNLLDRVVLAEAAAAEASAFRAQCAGYIQHQLGRLVVQQHSLNDFLRSELRPRDPNALELPPRQRRILRSFLHSDPPGWMAAYDDVVVWLDAQTEALERWVRHLPLYVGAHEGLDLKREEVSLAPLLYSLCEEKREQYENSLHISSHLPCTPRIHGDLSGLRDALAALIDNGCMNTPHGGTVTVTLHCSDDTATIAVTDTGAGIAPDDLPHIFTRFHHTAISRSGQGLGLPFAHDVIVQHGGTLSVESAPGEGNTFTVRLPQEGSGGQ